MATATSALVKAYKISRWTMVVVLLGSLIGMLVKTITDIKKLPKSGENANTSPTPGYVLAVPATTAGVFVGQGFNILVSYLLSDTHPKPGSYKFSYWLFFVELALLSGMLASGAYVWNKQTVAGCDMSHILSASEQISGGVGCAGSPIVPAWGVALGSLWGVFFLLHLAITIVHIRHPEKLPRYRPGNRHTGSRDNGEDVGLDLYVIRQSRPKNRRSSGGSMISLGAFCCLGD